MTAPATVALVGATGGAGTTRLTVEFGATLARTGRDVALFDAAFATQGLARHVPGRIETDLTDLLTDADTAALEAAMIDLDVELPGRLAACPVRAPFERLARAKTVEAAKRLEDRLAVAADRFDHVLVDVPPVGANQAVAAVSAADRVVLVAPATTRGADRLTTLRDRLYDVGAQADVVVANQTGGGVPDEAARESAEVVIPESEGAVAGRPICADPDGAFAPAVAEAVATVFDCDLDLSFEDGGVVQSVFSS
jgi:cellulose biosynthesis protein BcsQ